MDDVGMVRPRNEILRETFFYFAKVFLFAYNMLKLQIKNVRRLEKWISKWISKCGI